MHGIENYCGIKLFDSLKLFVQRETLFRVREGTYLHPRPDSMICMHQAGGMGFGCDDKTFARSAIRNKLEPGHNSFASSQYGLFSL